MIRFVTYAFPLLLMLLALFGFAVEVLDLEPQSGAVIRLAIFEQPSVPATLVLGAWIMEACGLLALFLLAQGRCGTWWLDGLVAGWLAWVFRGPLLVLTIVVAARQPQDPWWDIALGWWILYSICGLSMAVLARRSGIIFANETEPALESHHLRVEPESAAPASPPSVEPSAQPLLAEVEVGEARDSSVESGEAEESGDGYPIPGSRLSAGGISGGETSGGETSDRQSFEDQASEDEIHESDDSNADSAKRIDD